MNHLILFIALLLITGCAAPKLKRPALTPPMPPKRAMSTAPRILRAQAPTELWLVWGPKTWVELEWTRNKDSNVIAYIIYRGTTSGDYEAQFNAGNNESAWIPVLPGTRHYFAAKAINRDGYESDEFSNEVTYDAPLSQPFYARLLRETPLDAPNGAFKIESKDSLNAPWEYHANVTNAFLPVTATGNKIFRVLKQP